MLIWELIVFSMWTSWAILLAMQLPFVCEEVNQLEGTLAQSRNRKKDAVTSTNKGIVYKLMKVI